MLRQKDSALQLAASEVWLHSSACRQFTTEGWQQMKQCTTVLPAGELPDYMPWAQCLCVGLHYNLRQH